MNSRMVMEFLPEFLRDTLVALGPGLGHLLAGWVILG